MTSHGERCDATVVVLLTSQIGGLVNERRHYQQGAVLFAEPSGSLLGDEVKFRLLLLDPQPPGNDLLLHLSPAVLLILLACQIR